MQSLGLNGWVGQPPLNMVAQDGGRNCIQCTEGMNCLGLNDVRIEEGYFAEEPRALNTACLKKAKFRERPTRLFPKETKTHPRAHLPMT
eukprot:1567191-Amphidinium_carterae.1